MNGLKNLLLAAASVILIVMLLSVFNTPEKQFEGEPVKIGLVGPWTGPSAKNGISMKEGAEIAVRNINENGGINGRELILIEYDDKSVPDECIKAVKKLIFDDKAAAIIGPFNSSCCVAVSDIANENKIPLITPIAMADEINQKDDYVFRNTLGVKESNQKTDEFANMKNGEFFMLEGTGSRTIGILWQNDIWGVQMKETVVSRLEKLGKMKSLVFCESFELGQKDFNAVFRKYKGKYPDIIYVIALADEAVLIVKQGRSEGYEGLFYGEGGFNSFDFDKELNKIADGCLFSTQWHPSFSTPMSDVFVKLYLKRYEGKLPDMFSAITYEAAYILKKAMENTEADISDINAFREKLRNRIAGIRNFSGISGTISFDSVGQCDRPVFVLQKRWDGHKIESIIIYPKEYEQGKLLLKFNKNE